MHKTDGYCTWKEDDCGLWETDCKHIFEIIDGTPIGNDMIYCCYCGKQIDEVLYLEVEK